MPKERDEEKRKPAPPRNDMASAELYRNSRALELQNRDPEYVYAAFSTDPDSPGYIGKRLRQHEAGTPYGGYTMVGAWEVVHSQTDRDVKAMDPREDQGKPVDTVMRYGRQIMCRIRRDEHAKYAVAEDAGQKAMERQLYEPDRLGDGQIATTSVVSRDENANQLAMLRQSGHPLPGA